MMLHSMQSNQPNNKRRHKEQTKARSEAGRSEDSLDFVQALNTALCFLCWTNMDATVVDSFLRMYPEALLFEGTSKDSARNIVEQRMRRCTCTDTRCNDNRIEILKKLDKGFEEYQRKHMKDLLRGNASNKSQQNIVKLKSTFVFPQLMTSGRYLRGLSVEESAVRSQVLETHVSKVAIEQELKDLKVSIERTPRSRIRALFACGSERGKDQGVRLSKLELDLQMAEMNMASAQKEHNLLIEAIDRGQRNQYILLKNAFEGCHHFVCGTQENEDDVARL